MKKIDIHIILDSKTIVKYLYYFFNLFLPLVVIILFILYFKKKYEQENENKILKKNLEKILEYCDPFDFYDDKDKFFIV